MDKKLIIPAILISLIAVNKWNSHDSDYKIVQGNSMEPTFKDGEFVKIEEVEDEKEITINDFVVFEASNGYWFHRVIGINNDSDGKYFITKGDNKLIPDLDNITLTKTGYFGPVHKLRFNQINGKFVGK